MPTEASASATLARTDREGRHVDAAGDQFVDPAHDVGHHHGAHVLHRQPGRRQHGVDRLLDGFLARVAVGDGLALHVGDRLDVGIGAHEQADLDREDHRDRAQLRVRPLVEGADAVVGLVQFQRAGEAEIDLARIDQRDHGGGAGRRLHPRLQVGGVGQRLGDRGADRVGHRALRAGAETDRLRQRLTGGTGDDGGGGQTDDRSC